METLSNVVANVTLFGIIAGFISLAMIKRVNVYEAFIEGAKDGFPVIIKIIPYLVAILVAIGVFRASGAMGYLGLKTLRATLVGCSLSTRRHQAVRSDSTAVKTSQHPAVQS